MSHTSGDGAAVVIEATGTPQAILTAFGLARFGGRVILLGSTRGETEKVNFYADVHKKGLTVDWGAQQRASDERVGGGLVDGTRRSAGGAGTAGARPACGRAVDHASIPLARRGGGI